MLRISKTLLVFVILCFCSNKTIGEEMNRGPAPNDCGVKSLYILLNFYNKKISFQKLKTKFSSEKNGYSVNELRKASTACGLEVDCVNIGKQKPTLSTPYIAFLRTEHSGHFLVVRPVGKTGTMAQVIDPPFVPKIVDLDELVHNPSWTGIILIPRESNIIRWIIVSMVIIIALIALLAYLSRFIIKKRATNY